MNESKKAYESTECKKPFIAKVFLTMACYELEHVIHN